MAVSPNAQALGYQVEGDVLRNDYEILGVSPSATDEELRRSYLDLVKVWHPDRFVGDSRLQAKASQHLKEINDAYRRLRGASDEPRPQQRPSRASGRSAPRQRRPSERSPRSSPRPKAKASPGASESSRHQANVLFQNKMIAVGFGLAFLVVVFTGLDDSPEPPPADANYRVPSPPEALGRDFTNLRSSIRVNRQPARTEGGEAPSPSSGKGSWFDQFQNEELSEAIPPSLPDAGSMRPLSGEELISVQDTEGLGILRIENGTDLDGAVVLCAGEPTRSACAPKDQRRGVYVRSGENTVLPSVTTGSYSIQVMFGQRWSGIGFLDARYTEFDKGFTFEDVSQADGIQYDEVTITLHSVVDGNLSSSDIPPFVLRQN